MLIPFLKAAAPDSSNDTGSGTDKAVEQKSDNYTQVYFDELADELSKGVDSANCF